MEDLALTQSGTQIPRIAGPGRGLAVFSAVDELQQQYGAFAIPPSPPSQQIGKYGGFDSDRTVYGSISSNLVGGLNETEGLRETEPHGG